MSLKKTALQHSVNFTTPHDCVPHAVDSSHTHKNCYFISLFEIWNVVKGQTVTRHYVDPALLFKLPLTMTFVLSLSFSHIQLDVQMRSRPVDPSCHPFLWWQLSILPSSFSYSFSPLLLFYFWPICSPASSHLLLSHLQRHPVIQVSHGLSDSTLTHIMRMNWNVRSLMSLPTRCCALFTQCNDSAMSTNCWLCYFTSN